MVSEGRVFINGEFVGTHQDPKKLVKDIKRLRRSSQISNQINATYFERTNEILISTDSGRARRPLMIVEDGKPLVTEEHIESLKNGEIGFDDLVELICAKKI